MTVNISNIYPDILNMYGDRGNISALCYRMKKRGINVKVTDYAPGDEIDFDSSDIVYIGGGTEKDQVNALKSLLEQKDALKKYVEDGGCLLSVCSGYEILGNSFYAEGKKVRGLGILNLDFQKKNERMIGDVVIESALTKEKITGFENHCGYFSEDEYEPLGRVISGFGSSGGKGFEGTVYKNLIGTYIHGPLLPVNPGLTDHIISVASKKYGEINISPLDDEIEAKSRAYVCDRNIK